MGDMVQDKINGFSDNCTAMGNSFGILNKQVDVETDIQNQVSTDIENTLNDSQKLLVTDSDKKEQCTASRTQCVSPKCDEDLVNNCGCEESKANFEKLKEMQSNWVELHKCIRFIYKNAISSVPCVVINEEIPKRISDSITQLVEKLYEDDFQQLFIRVEVLVRDFVLEAKDRLKDLQSNVEDIPVLYLKGLLASYGAFCLAADKLAPFLPQLDTLLMKRFSVNFQSLNKYIFHSCLYADSIVQNNVPLYISQLRTPNSGAHYSNQELVHSYLAFDDEMTDIASKWLDVKKMILNLSKKRIAPNPKQPLLFEEWKLYREHKDLAASRSWQLRLVKNNSPEFDIQLLSLSDDITSHMCEFELNPNLKQILNICRNCNSDICCSCDDCIIKHIISCVETPPTSPDRSSTDSKRTSAEIIEHFKAMATVNKVLLPKNFVKLITDKVMSSAFYKACNQEGEGHSECEFSMKVQSAVTVTTAVNISPTAAAPTTTAPKVPVSTSVANSITNSTQHTNNLESTNSPTSTSEKPGRVLKDVTKSTQNKMSQCNHQYQAIKKPKDQQPCKDGCAEHGPVKNPKESKRCDCPHCEVFENAGGQISNKNNKTRDRLRIRLVEKRNKEVSKNVETKPVEQENVATKTTKTCVDVQACINTPEVEDTRDIKELIDFIEGTDRNAKLINAQKRLAKKARRRERKLEEERIKEEERQRVEAERLLEEKRRLEELKRQEEARLREQQAAKNKKKNKNSTKSKDTGGKQIKGNVKSVKLFPEVSSPYLPPSFNEKMRLHSNSGGGRMVTIKRVMEHSNSEPTVTITLKGSTPDKDKLLYTLVNGQTNLANSVEVANSIKPDNLTKNQKKRAKKEQKRAKKEPKQIFQQQQQQQQPKQEQQVKEISKTLSKKERKKLRNETQKHNISIEQNTHNKIDSTNDVKKSATAPVSNTISTTDSQLNLQMLRLPPGITITKVDGPAVNRKLRSNANELPASTPPPPPSVPIQSSDNRSGVIVVDTVKLKQLVIPADIEQQQQQQPQQLVQQPQTTSNKKKKKKNKNKSENINPNTNQTQNQQNIPFAYKMPSDVASMKSTTTNGNSIVTIKNPMFYQLQESLNGKMNKPKLIENVKDNNRPQQASIIKGANGMVTIRSPRLNGNISNGHSEIPVGIGDLKPVLGPNTSVYKPIKQETNKPFNAQEILSGLPGIEITKINKNSTRNKNDCKVFQPADVSIIPTNISNGTNGDVYKLFSDNTDWTLESVFAPKDIKEDEELDADELELEAFKRFCQQSVPPERKEKVAHLNVKDIVLRKKTSQT